MKDKPYRRNRPAARSSAQSLHFDNAVQEAVDALPDNFRRTLRNLSIIVEDEASPQLLKELGHDPDEDLLGLYVGVPLPERSFGGEPLLPDQIYLFRRPLLEMCETTDELLEQIRITLIHELAHYFGFDEDYLRELGLD